MAAGVAIAMIEQVVDAEAKVPRLARWSEQEIQIGEIVGGNTRLAAIGAARINPLVFESGAQAG